jgi:hypothetical protein
MKPSLTAFLAYQGKSATRETVRELQESPIGKIFLLAGDRDAEALPGTTLIRVDRMLSTKTMGAIASRAGNGHALLVTREVPVSFGQFGLERFLSAARDTGAAMVYSDRYDRRLSARVPHPVIEYQSGSIRDDFDFGPVMVFDASMLRTAWEDIARTTYAHAGLYALRLAASRRGPIFRIGEFLYSAGEPDARRSGEKLFDYVDPRNREVQIEMEAAATAHLKRIGAYLKPKFKKADVAGGEFPVEATVVIPVRNRARTIGDAVASVQRQRTSFPFNCIVVDNHSTDGTTDALRRISAGDPRIIHLIPEREDLGIGGCWNEAAHYPQCGRFSVQLDSDDLYIDEFTLQRVVDCFRSGEYAMVIGSYRMTNFDLQEIPPGLIDHREWTPENGRNNALRINGLGAPRAFSTAILRTHPIPNVSYGEDYALGLAISREYQIGRIFEPLYLCRRWEGNSDANLDIDRQNAFNHYKDKLRSIEISARRRMNSAGRSLKGR